MRADRVRFLPWGASVFAVSAAWFSHAPLVARQQNQAPTFRSAVDLVRLDVSVIDKDRQPIRGLTAADFTVLEDGKPQAVVAFSAVDLADPPAPPVVNGHAVTWMRDIASDVQSNSAAVDRPESRLFVLLIDDAMIPNDASMIQNTKRIARSVIERLGPSDRVAVVMSADSQGAHDFTSDKMKLLADLDKMHPGYASYYFGWDTIESKFTHDCHPHAMVARLSDGDIGPRDWSFNTLRSVAEALMAAPERRKALIYVGPGLPINPGDAGQPPVGNPSGVRPGNTGPPLLPESSTCILPTPPPRESAVIHEANVNLFTELPALFRRMQLASVVMYPIDPTGLDGLSGYIARAYAGLAQIQ